MRLSLSKKMHQEKRSKYFYVVLLNFTLLKFDIYACHSLSLLIPVFVVFYTAKYINAQMHN